MDLTENYKIAQSLKGKCMESHLLTKAGKLRKRGGKGRKKKLKIFKEIRVASAISDLDPEWRFVLIDYKSDNQQIKAKMMTHKEAYEKNKLLRGSGFAWAKCQG